MATDENNLTMAINDHDTQKDIQNGTTNITNPRDRDKPTKTKTSKSVKIKSFSEENSSDSSSHDFNPSPAIAVDYSKTVSMDTTIAPDIVKMKPMDDGWGVTARGTILTLHSIQGVADIDSDTLEVTNDDYRRYKTYVLKYHSHVKWLLGPMYYLYLLPHNKTQHIISHILWLFISMLWISFTVVILYIFVDPDKIGADYCSEELAKFGFISVMIIIMLNSTVAVQMWLVMWYNGRFQEICLNLDVSNRILDETRKAAYSKSCKLRFISNIIMSLPVPVLLTNMLVNTPFAAKYYDDPSSWVMFLVFLLLYYICGVPSFSVANSFWYYTNFLCYYCESAQSQINALNNGDSIVNLYKAVRTFVEIASENYKILCVFMVLSHVLDFFLVVIYFAQCTNQNNYLMMLLLVMCSMVFLMPLAYMSQVTHKLRNFEKKVLYKLDAFGCVRAGFTTYILSMPIGYRFATDDIIIRKSTVFKIVNIIITIIIGVYRSIMTVRQENNR